MDSINVTALIDRDELIDFKLDRCTIDSASPTDGAATERVVALASAVEPPLFQPGYEAQGAENLVDAVLAHAQTFGSLPPESPSPACSMWRDGNSFNELGIPATIWRLYAVRVPSAAPTAC